MTREEAIKELEILKEDYWDDDGYGHETKQYDDTMLALDIAIKALEQEFCDKCIYSTSKGECQYDDITETIPPLEPCDDVVSRQAVLDLMRSLTRWCVRSEDGKFNDVGLLYDDVMFGIVKLPPVRPQEPKTGQFAEWAAREIFDDMWEYNKDAFAEIACRKLAKLGIVREKGNEWELVEPQESEEVNG